MFNLCLIGVDRYFVIVKPFLAICTKYKAYILRISEIAIWLLTIFVQLLLFDHMSGCKEDPMLCDIPNITPSAKAFMITHIISFVIPTVALIIIYYKIITYQMSYRLSGTNIENLWIEGQV
ncbi:hypothetical protein TrispH2_007399 [Trichoplax sp. H2]|nr:hypothetical protein TrispH2_007399 [Trichoplax sp. H2]|eukprot:RDD40888.1 hypothetical protein TrispH2_007399 [Trichoplax sp. H2]